MGGGQTFFVRSPMTTPEDQAYAKALIGRATEFYRQGHPALAEAYALEAVRSAPHVPEGHAALGALGLSYGQEEAAWGHLEGAGNFPPALHRLERLKARFGSKQKALEALQQRRAVNRGRFLIVKAWAYGFWADVFHVIGQALLAEITGRTIVTDWGRGSLYWHPDAGELFQSFFAPLSEYSMEQVEPLATTFYPRKWTEKNLRFDFVNRWHGPDSLAYAVPILKRTEDVVVSDFFTAPKTIARWLPSDHPLYGQEPGAVFKYLMAKYLIPHPCVTEPVDAFRREKMGEGPVLAVHVRGLDKAPDAPDIIEINREYFDLVDAWVAQRNPARILLITDSKAAVEQYRARYGAKLVTTDILRADDEKAAPYLKRGTAHKRRAALEVLIDTYLAAGCDWFIGNGWSNVSVAVAHLKDWKADALHLFGGNTAEEDFFNLFEPRPEEERDRFAVADEA